MRKDNVKLWFQAIVMVTIAVGLWYLIIFVI
jgi:hypothetical protein